MNKKIFLTELRRYAFMILGCLSYALSLKAFLEPNDITGGGVSGAASLIHLLTSLPTGLFIAIINVPILILGFKKMTLNHLYIFHIYLQSFEYLKF